MAMVKESIEKTDYKLINKVPNAETIESIENIEKGINLHEVANVDELFKELRSCNYFIGVKNGNAKHRNFKRN